MNERARVCPAEIGGMLDNRLRRWIHPREKIIGPYVNEGDFVLDLGCGPGSFTHALAQAAGSSGRVVAVDLQKKMLAAMEKKLTRLNLSSPVVSHLCQSDSLLLGEYNGKADFALAFWMAHETPDVNHFLGEVYDALKPKGRLLCVEPTLHVSCKKYEEMIVQGESLGFQAEPVEGIRLSRAVLFTK